MLADIVQGHRQTDFGVGFTAELDDLAALLKSQLETQSEQDSASDGEPDDGSPLRNPDGPMCQTLCVAADNFADDSSTI
tara:strand:+ start:871 stop:1107 length:237 start_codon:yes stop_codon:yes gene_type:complete